MERKWQLMARVWWGVTVASLISVGVRHLVPHLPLTVRWMLALLPVPLFVWAVVLIGQMLPLLDELQRRIQAETLTLALLVVTGLCYALGSLQEAGLAPRLAWSVLFPVILVIYFICYGITDRRYQ